GLVVERDLERPLGAERFGAQAVEHAVEPLAGIAVHDTGDVGRVIEHEGTTIVGRQLVAESGGQKGPSLLVELDQDFGPECHPTSPPDPAAGAPRPCVLRYTGCDGIAWDFPGRNNQPGDSARNLRVLRTGPIVP